MKLSESRANLNAFIDISFSKDKLIGSMITKNALNEPNFLLIFLR